MICQEFGIGACGVQSDPKTGLREPAWFVNASGRSERERERKSEEKKKQKKVKKAKKKKRKRRRKKAKKTRAS